MLVVQEREKGRPGSWNATRSACLALENSGERAEDAERVNWQETPQAETQHQRYKRPSEKPTYF